MEFKPLAKEARIESVDALRGFALLGILIANVPYAGFAGDMDVVSGALDSPLTFLFHLLIDKKFITIFSILFGFGFSIQMKRAASKNIDFTRYFAIRMLLLFVIGSLHTYILWNGDIIRAYALGGIFLLFVRKWPLRRLLITATVLCVLVTGIIFIGNSALEWRVYDYDYALAWELPTTTSYLRYVTINALIDPWTNFRQDMPITLVFTFGNMLIGLIMGKVDFFRLPSKLKKLTTWLIVLGSTVGLAASYVFYKITIGEIELDLPMLWLPFVLVVGMLLQSLAYMSIFVRLYHSKGFNKALRVFNPVGKTALSNYIFQSVLYLFVFFHCTHAFALFGKLTLVETYLLAVGFFVLQTLASYLWLRMRSQGPLEYVWKKISYSIANRNKEQMSSSGQIARS